MEKAGETVANETIGSPGIKVTVHGCGTVSKIPADVRVNRGSRHGVKRTEPASQSVGRSTGGFLAIVSRFLSHLVSSRLVFSQSFVLVPVARSRESRARGSSLHSSVNESSLHSSLYNLFLADARERTHTWRNRSFALLSVPPRASRTHRPVQKDTNSQTGTRTYARPPSLVRRDSGAHANASFSLERGTTARRRAAHAAQREAFAASCWSPCFLSFSYEGISRLAGSLSHDWQGASFSPSLSAG